MPSVTVLMGEERLVWLAHQAWESVGGAVAPILTGMAGSPLIWREEYPADAAQFTANTAAYVQKLEAERGKMHAALDGLERGGQGIRTVIAM